MANRERGVPKFLTKSAIFFVRGDIQRTTGHDIFGIDVTKAAKMIQNVPAYFMVSEDDILTPLSQVNKLYEMYACGNKKLKRLSGHHHT